jgi:flagellar motility protein MotE (MotC chaperone)
MIVRIIFILLALEALPCRSLANEAVAESSPRGDADSAAIEHSADTKNDHAKRKARQEKADSGELFCEGVVDAAREQRYYLKQQELKALLTSLDERLAVLDKRKAEYEEWVQRREDFAKHATANLVEIYSGMKPDASAVRLAELEQNLAASLLLAIAPRQASAILNEMDEKVAASLTGIMAASARTKDPS